MTNFDNEIAKMREALSQNDSRKVVKTLLESKEKFTWEYAEAHLGTERVLETHQWEIEKGFVYPYSYVAITRAPHSSWETRYPDYFQEETRKIENIFSKYGIGGQPKKCHICGNALLVHCIMKDATGKHFVSGADCVQKYCSPELASVVTLAKKESDKKRKILKNRLERQAREARERKENEGLTLAEKRDLERKREWEEIKNEVEKRRKEEKKKEVEKVAFMTPIIAPFQEYLWERLEYLEAFAYSTKGTKELIDSIAKGKTGLFCYSVIKNLAKQNVSNRTGKAFFEIRHNSKDFKNEVARLQKMLEDIEETSREYDKLFS